MRLSFAGSWVVVTGASSGLGEEFATVLAARGAKLVLTARSGDKLQTLAQKLAAAHGVDTEVVTADLAAPDGAAELCRKIDGLGVAVEHLINNAGFGSTGAFASAEPDVQARMVRVNCEALMRLSRHFLPAMIERRRGGIIHVASTASHQPVPYMATYAATKAFVLSFSLALAEEVRGHGVRISALCPGPVATGFQAVAGIDPSSFPKFAALSSEQTVARALRSYERGEAMCVPGAFNTFQTFCSKLAPRAIVVRGTGQAMRRLGRAR